ETYCLKATPGLPLQTDPAFCAKLWRRAQDNPRPDGPNAVADPGGWGDLQPNFAGPCATGGTPPPLPTPAEIRAALQSYRYQLCMALSGKCDPADGDPCVPLAAFVMIDGKIRAIDNCIVRPRLYSNATLLDIILCMLERMDECCGEAPPP